VTDNTLPARQLQVADLPIHPVDPTSPVPLYHQVEMDLRALITSGVIAPQDLLPPETELARHYGVGRQTIRMALSRLVADRLIGRQAGRGTFILTQSDRLNFYLDRSFTRQMIDMGMTTRSDVLHASTGAINSNSPKILRGKAAAPCFYIVRLRYGNDEPISLQYTTIITERCAGLEQHDFVHASLYDVLAREYQLPITRIIHTVTAIAADAYQAELLLVASGDPLLQVNTAAFLENSDVIESSMSYYRADKYEYSITHTL
jgi:GntR family transcriptional regulator